MEESCTDVEKHFRKVVFTCDQCRYGLTLKPFHISVSLHGIIFLVGETDGYIGIVCPKCHKTSLQKGSREGIEGTKNRYNTLMSGAGRYGLRYHSFPDRPLHTRAELRSVKYFNPEYKTTPAYEPYSGRYYPFFSGDLVIGRLRGVKRYKSENIHDLVKLENETGKRVFARYVLHEPLYEIISDFCLKDEFTFVWIDVGTDSLIPLLSTRAPKKRTVKAFDFLNLLDTTPSNIMFGTSASRAKDAPATEQEPGKTLEQLEKTHEIDKARHELDKLIHEVDNSQKQFANFYKRTPWPPPKRERIQERVLKLPPLEEFLRDCDAAKYGSGEKSRRYYLTINKAWDDFGKKDIRDLLCTMANRFIFEYEELVQKARFSFTDMLKLRENYLKELTDALESSHKRQLVKQRPSGAERRRVQEAEKLFPGVKIVSQDSQMNQLKIRLSQLAQFKDGGEDNYLDVLLLGETGTGKELFARAFHEASGRQGLFVPVNCAAIPENLFESQFFGHKKGAFTDATRDSKGYFKEAHGGTLFLDEIGELSPAFQSKFLRVIRDRKIQAVGASKADKVDVRIVIATNRDLDQMLANGDFRGDFYERINRFPFFIPPLRERKGDIELLAHHFIDKYDTERASNSNLDPITISKKSMKLLKKHDWKRNIGQLENVIARIVVFRLTNEDRGTITPDDLPSDILGLESETEEGSDIKEEIPPELKDFNDKIVYLMKRHNNKSKVAKILNCDYRTVLRRIQKYHLWPPKK